MLPILPWMPATAQVLGMDINLCRHVAVKATEKTEAAAAKLRAGEKPRGWGPLTIDFDYEGQRIKFASNVTVAPDDIDVQMITVTNQISFLEGKDEVFSYHEILYASLYRKLRDKPVNVRCNVYAVITTDIPLSLVAALPGQPLRSLVDLPGGFNEAVGDLKITEISGRMIGIDASASEKLITEQHQKFQDSLKISLPFNPRTYP